MGSIKIEEEMPLIKQTGVSSSFLNAKHILITGGAGFIGSRLAQRFLDETDAHLVIVDNMNPYYSSDLKRARLALLGIHKDDTTTNPRVAFYKIDIANNAEVEKMYKAYAFDVVIHLAAQAGVRYSLENPAAYIHSNVNGFFNILYGATQNGTRLMLYASSSSVYGGSQEVPFTESAPLTTPLSLYAATKMSNELIAATFAQNYDITCVGMRFFNVYGPWGRPDAVYYIWAEALLKQLPLEVRGRGMLRRDMTFIDDVTEAIFGLMSRYMLGETHRHEVYNIGNSQPVVMKNLLGHLSKHFGAATKINYTEKGQVEIDVTYADVSKLKQAIGFAPSTPG